MTKLFAIFSLLENIVEEGSDSVIFADPQSSLEDIKNCSHKHPLVLIIVLKYH